MVAVMTDDEITRAEERWLNRLSEPEIDEDEPDWNNDWENEDE